jgi:predicted patatin/cPLA2 family phospholipase
MGFYNKLALSCLAVSQVAGAENAKSCKAIAYSGGGSKGAYEAGALWGMYHSVKDKSELAYDVITGVSAGSINLFATAIFEKGNEIEMIEFVSKAWENLKNEQVWQYWPKKVIDPVLNKAGVLDDSPLLDYLYNIGKDLLPIKRKYLITATNVDTGNINKFTEKNFTDPHTLVREMVSSSSVPLVFPPQNWANQGLSNTVLMDGGVTYNLNLVGAVERCRENVDHDSQITIDIISCDNIDSYTGTPGKTINNYLLNRDIKKLRNQLSDTLLFMQGFPQVNFRYLVVASEFMASGVGILDFNNATTWGFQTLGRKDGANTVKLGGQWLRQMLNMWKDTNTIQQEYPDIVDYMQVSYLKDLQEKKIEEQADEDGTFL